MIRLNLGAGNDIRDGADGWVNVDIRPLPGIDVVADVRTLPFSLDTVDEILANDLLEHIPPAGVPDTLLEWRRVLKPGGRLTLRIPDIKKIARRLISGAITEDVAMLLLYGDQSPEWGGYEWGGHKWGYTDQQITNLLAQFDLWVQMVFSPTDEHALYIEAIAGETK